MYTHTEKKRDTYITAQDVELHSEDQTLLQPAPIGRPVKEGQL